MNVLVFLFIFPFHIAVPRPGHAEVCTPSASARQKEKRRRADDCERGPAPDAGGERADGRRPGFSERLRCCPGAPETRRIHVFTLKHPAHPRNTRAVLAAHAHRAERSGLIHFSDLSPSPTSSSSTSSSLSGGHARAGTRARTGTREQPGVPTQSRKSPRPILRSLFRQQSAGERAQKVKEDVLSGVVPVEER